MEKVDTSRASIKTRIFVVLGIITIFTGGALLIGGSGVLIGGIFISFFLSVIFNLLAEM